MSDIRHRLIGLGLLAAGLLGPTAGPACNVPVFRYALERWNPAPYALIVFHREPFTAEQQAFIGAIEKAGKDSMANLLVRRADVSRELSAPFQALWTAQMNPTLPWMVVRYPAETGIGLPVWTGPVSAAIGSALLESPARRDIAEKLLRGDAVVWLLLESGDRRRDEQVVRVVEAESRKLEQTLILPEPSPLDPPMNADLPLKIVFSTVRVARSNPAERMLVNLLLNWNTNLTAATEVMLFPVFGRGRVMPPAIGQEIQPEAIREMAEFLTGPCSCQVKEMNPGFDLLLSANWNSLPEYAEVSLPEPSPLVGMSQFAAAAASQPPAQSFQPAATPAPANMAPAPAGRHHLVRNLALVLGIGGFFLAAATLVLKARGSRGP